jgi:hypothetical protein
MGIGESLLSLRCLALRERCERCKGEGEDGRFTGSGKMEVGTGTVIEEWALFKKKIINADIFRLYSWTLEMFEFDKDSLLAKEMKQLKIQAVV